MTTTINRSGQITSTAIKEGKQTAIISFKGGYIKFYYSDEDVPDGLMLKDKVEVSLVINQE